MQEFIGKKFGKWTVLHYKGKFNRVHKFKVKCDCGNESISDYIALTRNKSTKCRSCARKENCKGTKNPAFKHGYSSVNHPNFHVYTAWCSMKSRCYRVSDKNYKRYGALGIKVCNRWLKSFEYFLEDMGHPEIGYSLDRIDVYGNYERNNCRWADRDTQSNNCRRTIYYEYKGEKLSESQWSKKLNISRNKFMWWVRKNGILWVMENLETIKKSKSRMNDQDYIDLRLELPNKIYRH